MNFFPPDFYYDFMRVRRFWITLSFALVAISVGLYIYPGPNYGIDFAGGTEVELKLPRPVAAGTLRKALEASGHSRPDVIQVGGGAKHYILRIQATSALTKAKKNTVRRRLAAELRDAHVEEVKFSPGGEKVSLRLTNAVTVGEVDAALRAAGLEPRGVVRFGPADVFRFEASLASVGDQAVRDLRTRLGASVIPERADRVEWVGPKAGKQLRNAGIQSILYAIIFIIIYIAFRFDLRFAPGGVVALVHDAVVTVGVFILLGKQVNLQLVAAVLTVIGYSINDTVVVYDRIRENIGRLRERDFGYIINMSVSQTLSRTLLTGGGTFISIVALYVWGTPTIKDFSLALGVGILAGTYSSIYVAAPLTEWIDRRFFHKAAA